MARRLIMTRMGISHTRSGVGKWEKWSIAPKANRNPRRFSVVNQLVDYLIGCPDKVVYNNPESHGNELTGYQADKKRLAPVIERRTAIFQDAPFDKP